MPREYGPEGCGGGTRRMDVVEGHGGRMWWRAAAEGRSGSLGPWPRSPPGPSALVLASDKGASVSRDHALSTWPVY